jgi:dTDP-D-glucose 4,6-dehydratase
MVQINIQKNLIPKFKRLLKEGKKCTIHGKNCANIKRAFMHVEDVVDAVEVVWNNGVSGEIYNIASDDELTVMEVTQLIIETMYWKQKIMTNGLHMLKIDLSMIKDITFVQINSNHLGGVKRKQEKILKSF